MNEMVTSTLPGIPTGLAMYPQTRVSLAPLKINAYDFIKL